MKKEVHFRVRGVRRDEAYAEVDTPDGKDHVLTDALVVEIEVTEREAFAHFREGAEYRAVLCPPPSAHG